MVGGRISLRTQCRKGVRSHLTTTWFFCRHVRTVTLVTMQHICDGIKNMLTTTTICVVVAKCERTLTVAGRYLELSENLFTGGGGGAVDGGGSGSSIPFLDFVSPPIAFPTFPTWTFLFISGQGGHIPAKIKFPVFSLSFPCAR